MNILIWGAGNNGKYVIGEIKKNAELFSDNYIGVIDNDISKTGAYINGIMIYWINAIEYLQYDYIILKNRFDVEIRKQLIDELNVAEDKIITFQDYEGICYARHEYQLKYDDTMEKSKVFDTDKIVVYTANFGKYDRLENPLYVDDKITYVCFTDDKNYKSNVWNIEYMSCDFNQERIKAKEVKLFANRYFSDYKTSIWVDSKFLVVEDLSKYIETYQKTKDILCFPHNERKCIYDEAGACLTYHRGKREEIVPQMVKYYKEAVPFDIGLYDSGCLVRNHNNDQIIYLMERWFEEINRYSKRDQISLPYIFYKYGFEPDISDLNIYKNQWLKLIGHINEAAVYEH